MPMRAGNKVKKVYYSPREWAIVQTKAEKANCRVGTYIRHVSVEGEVKIFDLEILSNLQLELNRIGTSINQVALVVNSTKQVYKNDIEELVKEFEKIEKAVDEALTDFTGQRDLWR